MSAESLATVPCENFAGGNDGPLGPLIWLFILQVDSKTAEAIGIHSPIELDDIVLFEEGRVPKLIHRAPSKSLGCLCLFCEFSILINISAKASNNIMFRKRRRGLRACESLGNFSMSNDVKVNLYDTSAPLG